MNTIEILDLLDFARDNQLSTLDLSNHEITELPNDFKQLTYLQTLDLRGNNLSQLPSSLGYLEKLQSLYLDNNQLAALPSWISDLTSLRTLSLSTNRLKSLPTEIESLIRLQVLSLSNNKLKTLPNHICNLNNLEALSLSNNEIQYIPECLGQLSELRELSLANNRISSLPHQLLLLSKLERMALDGNELEEFGIDLRSWNKLRILSLIGNRISRFPIGLAQLTQLQSLALDNNQLFDLPSDIGGLSNIEALSLTGNKIAALPAELGNLSKLKSLKLSHNRIVEVPPEIAELTNLHTLTLDYNLLTTLPNEIGDLRNLATLNLDGNRLREIPTAIGNLRELQNLSLNGTRLTDIPTSILSLKSLQGLSLANNNISSLPSAIRELRLLVSLSLSNNHLTELVNEIFQLENLRSLHLSGNKLRYISSEIGSLHNLRELSLADNSLSELPVECMHLTCLETLILDRNQFASFPGAVPRIRSLKMLSMDGNHIDVIPKEVSSLDQLETLSIADNNIHDLPNELYEIQSLQWLSVNNNDLHFLSDRIGRLRNLRRLNLNNNKISVIPSEIQQLSLLTTLSIAKNDLAELPTGIVKLRNLHLLWLNDNPLKIPSEIISSFDEPARIISYYVNQIGQGQSRLNEVRMILVGQSGVGKTSVSRRLRDNNFEPNEEVTKGISIRNWRFRDPNSPEIAVKIWDFGGQEIMHATHQFFLSKRSLYLLVLDSRLSETENRLEYWLKIIQAFGADSPIVLIGNKTDQNVFDIDERGLRQRYPSIGSVIGVSCRNGDGFGNLVAQIKNEVKKLPSLVDLVPSRWLTIKETLEGMKRNHISFEAFSELCAQEGITKKEDQRVLLGFLHDLGVILWFQDDPRLNNVGILNPDWVTHAVYDILNFQPLFENRGVLTWKMLSEVLNSPEYSSEKRMFVVNLMRKFELCYEFEGLSEPTFLIPDLLPRAEMYTGDWADSITFEYHYSILPSSVISRFIVRMNHVIHGGTCWRTGVVIRQGDNLGLVKADLLERTIKIRVRGPAHTRRDMLSMIRFELSAIHRTVPGMIVSEKVPHPKFAELLLDYQELLQFERAGVDTFPKLVDQNVVMINVVELLDGIDLWKDRQKIEPGDMALPQNRSESGSRRDTFASNPWRAGSFYLLAFMVVLIAYVSTAILTRDILPFAYLTGIVIASLLVIFLVGIFQLRNDNRLSDASFNTLAREFLKYIFKIR